MTKKKSRNAKFVWQDAFITSGLTGNTGFIALLMATKDNGDGKGFFISANQIAEMTGLSERSIRTHITALRDAGWIEVTHRGGNQGGTARANRYKLTYPDAHQPEDPRRQPEPDRPLPEASNRLVDQYSLDQSLVDPASLKEGDALPVEVVKTLDPVYQARFFPPFDDRQGVLIYSPKLPSGQSAGGDTRSEESRRRGRGWMLREEGLDEYGEPKPRRTGASRPRRRS